MIATDIDPIAGPLAYGLAVTTTDPARPGEPTETPTCPGCGGAGWQPWRNPNPEWAYLRCSSCGLARIDPMPTPDQLGAVFDGGYFTDGGDKGGYADYDADAETHRLNARDRLAGLPAPRPRADGRAPVLVDVGCASGYVLEVAQERGWRAIGVEVVPEMADRARAKGFTVVGGLDEVAAALGGGDGPATEPGSGDDSAAELGGDDPAAAGGVAVVCFFQVLEHLPDPLAALRQARRLAGDDGVLLCETWDGASRIAWAAGNRWQQLSPPSVLWVFDELSARSMLARAGWRQNRWRRTSKAISLGWVAGQLAPRLPGPLATTMRRAVQPVERVRLRYGLGDLVLLSAGTGQTSPQTSAQTLPPTSTQTSPAASQQTSPPTSPRT